MAVAGLMAIGAGEVRAQDGVVFGFELGYKEMGGGLGDVLDGGIIGEYSFVYQKGRFRYGLAFNLVSLDVVEPFDESVSQVGASLLWTWLIKQGTSVLPYLELRLGGVRYRPEGDTFAPEEPVQLDQDEDEGKNAADAVDGFEGSLLGGAEFAISKKLAIDLSAAFSFISTEEVDLSAIGLGPVDSGTAWSVRLGLRWNP